LPLKWPISSPLTLHAGILLYKYFNMYKGEYNHEWDQQIQIKQLNNIWTKLLLQSCKSDNCYPHFPNEEHINV
jgi:hypothetical protein